MPDLIDFLQTACERGASDLHITAGSPPMIRLNGTLQPLPHPPLDGEMTRNLILSVLKESQRAILETEFELDFALQVEGLGRFRGNSHLCRGNIEAAFRHIPEGLPNLEKLGHSQTVVDLCKARQGLVLVTGVTGSGKTTTLAAMTKHIADTRPGVVVTIEDPIEFVFPHSYGIVKQRQVGSDTRGFSSALRAALRQDPDVIVVSELRDLEAVRTAITAAETGHLVIATLHTIDAPKSIDRLVDVFPESQQSYIRSQLANALLAVVSQHLIKRVSKEGGRALATEVMVMNDAIRSCVRENKIEQLPSLIQIGRRDGMHTIDDDLSRLWEAKLISADDALALARDQPRLRALIETPKKKGWL